MPRLEYHEDAKTGDRMVSAHGLAVRKNGPVHGQCDCGSGVDLARNGDAVECIGCNAVYRFMGGSFESTVES